MKPSLGTGLLALWTTVSVAAVVAGIVVVGSPTEGRLDRFDAGRVEDLRTIMSAIDAAFAREGVIPASLQELASDPRTRINPLDPVTEEPYPYTVLGEESYLLCATFQGESALLENGNPDRFWSHPAGPHCYELTAKGAP